MFSFIGSAFSFVYHSIFYRPLYNGLVFLIGILPQGDVALAIIILTLLIRFVLYPLSKKSLESQRKMKELGPQMEKIKVDFKDNKDEQARRTLALYKDNNINPFSGILFLLIQLPLVIALYQVFRAGLTMIDPTLLYSFIHVPSVIGTHFFGVFNISATHNIIFAVLAAVSQYFQAKYTLAAPGMKAAATPTDPNKPPSFQDEFAKSMNLQMKYMLPAFIGFIAYGVPAGLTLYWITNNLFSIGQELRKK